MNRIFYCFQPNNYYLNSMRLQVNMNCKECGEVWPVRVNAEDNFAVKTDKKSINKMDSSHIYEQISCPDCGEENLWDSLNRRFTRN